MEIIPALSEHVKAKWSNEPRIREFLLAKVIDVLNEDDDETQTLKVMWTARNAISRIISDANSYRDMFGTEPPLDMSQKEYQKINQELISLMTKYQDLYTEKLLSDIGWNNLSVEMFRRCFRACILEHNTVQISPQVTVVIQT